MKKYPDISMQIMRDDLPKASKEYTDKDNILFQLNQFSKKLNQKDEFVFGILQISVDKIEENLITTSDNKVLNDEIIKK